MRLAARPEPLLDAAFEDMTEHDGERTLGGVHAMVWESAELIDNAARIQRRLLRGVTERGGCSGRTAGGSGSASES